MVATQYIRSALAAAVGLAGACSSSDEPGPEAPLDAQVEPQKTPPDAAAPPPEPAYGAEYRSVRLRRSISVRIEPRGEALRYGTVARDTLVGFGRAVEGPDCDTRWVEIEPRGWVCDGYLEPSTRRPEGVELPKLERGELVPGRYAGVRGEDAHFWTFDEEGQPVQGDRVVGSVLVRHHGDRTVDGITYWRIGLGADARYVRADMLREQRPSEFSGTRLGDDTGMTLPLGFPMNRKNASWGVDAYDAPAGGRKVDRLPGRVPVPVLETATGENGRPIAYRVAESVWVPAAELRVARETEPPGLITPHERWIDIDLDEQLLVAYEGTAPVYATLVSTGSRRHPTETGVYRIWIKFAEVDMSDLAGESPYAVATVPWTQFYAKDLALHTAYWHDTFGTQRSHGCTNLSPRDARFLYFWSEPRLPPGWSMANGTVEQPGSLVRVRSSEDPAPEMKGYALRVEEARRAARDRALVGPRAARAE